MSESINTIVDKVAYEQVDQLTQKLEKADLALLSIIENAGKVNLGKIKLPADVDQQLKKNSQYVEQLNRHQEESIAIQKRLEASRRNLAVAESQVNREIQANRYAAQEANRQDKLRARISSTLAGEYKRQSAILDKLKEDYRNVAAEMGDNSREAKKLQREVSELDAKLKRIDSNVGNFQRNVGNYKSAWGGLKDMVMASVAAFGVYEALNIGREIYSQIKEINALNKALLQVTETQDAFNQAQGFLIDLAERSGAELNTLQKGYTKFLASAKETNLTLEETQYIYETVATAGSVLGQSTEEVNGAMRALEQMLSKGKIQAEEIRGQLGERLPGAYQILAKSMGLTNQELDKQLELGTVIADEVLPGFARELERSFGLDKVEKVETLTAAQGRLHNSWNLYLRSLEDGNGFISRVLIATFDALSSKIKQVTEDSTELGEEFSQVTRVFNETVDEIGDVTGEAEKLETALGKVGEVLKFLKWLFTLSIFNVWAEGLKAVRVTYEALSAAMIKTTDIGNDIVAQIKKGDFKEAYDLLINANQIVSASYRNEWASAYASVKTNTEAIEKQMKAFVAKYGSLAPLSKDQPYWDFTQIPVPEPTDNTDDNGEEKVKQRAKVEEILIQTYDRSMAAMEEYKKYLTEIQSKLATSSDQYAHIQTLIDSVSESMSKLDGSYDFAADIELPEANALQNFLNNKIPGQAERLSKILGENKQALMEEFLSLYEWDYNNWLKFQQQKLQSQDDYGGKLTEKQVEQISNWINEAQLMFQALGDISAGFSERRIQQIEREMEANEKMYDEILANENLSERQRKLTEEQREKDRERLNKKKEKEQIKQAKMAKAQAALNVVLNTSMAIISALAQVPKFDFGISAGATAALYAATGAAQLAAVLAQPIPKYAKGREDGPAEWAITGDGGRKEVVTDPNDNPVWTTPSKPTLTYLPKNYKVYPSEDAFKKRSYDAIMRASVLTSMAHQQENLSAAQMGERFDYEMMMQTIDSGIKEGFKNVKINNHNHNSGNDDLAERLKFIAQRDV